MRNVSIPCRPRGGCCPEELSIGQAFFHFMLSYRTSDLAGEANAYGLDCGDDDALMLPQSWTHAASC